MNKIIDKRLKKYYFKIFKNIIQTSIIYKYLQCILIIEPVPNKIYNRMRW